MVGCTFSLSSVIPLAAGTETFSRYANGVRAINGSLTSAPTPLGLNENVSLMTA